MASAAEEDRTEQADSIEAKEEVDAEDDDDEDNVGEIPENWLANWLLPADNRLLSRRNSGCILFNWLLRRRFLLRLWMATDNFGLTATTAAAAPLAKKCWKLFKRNDEEVFNDGWSFILAPVKIRPKVKMSQLALSALDW